MPSSGSQMNGSLVRMRTTGIRSGKKLGVVIICSRKVDKRATRRNLLRRRVREIIRKDLKGRIKKAPLVIEIKPEARDSSYASLREDILHVLHLS